MRWRRLIVASATLPTGNKKGDIFNWQLSGATGTTFPVWTGVSGSHLTDAEFNATFSGLTLSDTFWSPASGQHKWTAITGLNSLPTFSTTTFGTYTAGYGTFSTTATATGLEVVWTPVPEPTSALAGLLLTAGLLRRKRR